jgi:hypothetical protein
MNIRLCIKMWLITIGCLYASERIPESEPSPPTVRRSMIKFNNRPIPVIYDLEKEIVYVNQGLYKIYKEKGYSAMMKIVQDQIDQCENERTKPCKPSTK